MDEESILFGIRNLFALGNYQTVINDVSSSNGLFSPEAKLEAQTYLYRSYVAQGKYNLVINDIADNQEAALKAIKLLATYLQAKQKNQVETCDQVLEQARQLLEEGANRTNASIQTTIATIFVNAQQTEEALKIIHLRQKKLECAALAVQIYLQMDRLDLARNEVNAAKAWAEDALLLQMMEAWVGLRVGGEKYQEAFYIYEEFGQSSASQTIKVMNGQAAAHIALGRYPEAESILLEALNKNSDDPDTLVNMIVCANLTSKSPDVVNRYVNQLREVAPQHPFIQDMDLKSSLFDRTAARFALVDAS
ncbi:coatomer epsilon subunit-domain-containing protein [Radiomyces spectabilis]|uniref:coatomer epsilon subunit-domain-containing protein n=1 Tax=Radiomyces spectabilis TaxID=64574 RepID=UPI00221E8D38|nr:coatomer epsilon subunit-domain-containing protein [Radiomyces spectabilis]KAI8381410.1 coatomer epsilon subunit-domain-containing protein [Radiomyces spectabilis]